MRAAALCCLLAASFAFSAAPPNGRMLTPEQKKALEKIEEMVGDATFLFGKKKHAEGMAKLEEVREFQEKVLGRYHYATAAFYGFHSFWAGSKGDLAAAL